MVVEGVLRGLRKTPVAGPTVLAARVNGLLGRDDLNVANIQSALEQIPGCPCCRPCGLPIPRAGESPAAMPAYGWPTPRLWPRW